MLIEHSFVTTMPAPEAMAAAARLLGDRGFAAERNDAFRVDQTEWNRLLMRRGTKSLRQARIATQCPQRILMEWDRGRVFVAATIEPKVARRSFGFGPSFAGTSKLGKKQSREYEDFLTAIVVAVESSLAARATDDVASGQWVAMESEFDEKARKAKRRSLILLLVLGAIILAAFAIPLAIEASSHH